MFEIVELWHQKCLSDSKNALLCNPPHTHSQQRSYEDLLYVGKFLLFSLEKMTVWHSHRARPSTSRWHSKVGMTFFFFCSLPFLYVVLLVYTNKCNPMNALQRRVSENVQSYSHILMFITSSTPLRQPGFFTPAFECGCLDLEQTLLPPVLCCDVFEDFLTFNLFFFS